MPVRAGVILLTNSYDVREQIIKVGDQRLPASGISSLFMLVLASLLSVLLGSLCVTSFEEIPFVSRGDSAHRYSGLSHPLPLRFP